MMVFRGLAFGSGVKILRRWSMFKAEYRSEGADIWEVELVLLSTRSEQARFGEGREVFARCYGMVRSWGLVDFEVDLPVEFSPSLLRVGVKQRALVSWAPVPVDGVPQLGLRVVDVTGGCDGGQAWLGAWSLEGRAAT